MIKGFFTALGWVIAAYVGLFILWFVMSIGCLQYADQHQMAPSQCGENTLTKIVMVTHAPIIKLLTK